MNGTKRVVLPVVTLTALSLSVMNIQGLAQCHVTEACPPCYSDTKQYSNTVGGTHNGVTALNVGFCHGFTNFTSAQYTTISNGIQDAVTAWNNTTDTCGNHAPYYLNYTGTCSNYDFFVNIQTVNGACAQGGSTISLSPTITNASESQVATIVKHELGHTAFGLANSNDTAPCDTGTEIMNATATLGCIPSNATLQGPDITQANLAKNSPSSCFKTGSANASPISCETRPACISNLTRGSACPGGNEDASCVWASPNPCSYPTSPNCPGAMKFDGANSCCYTTTSPIIIDLAGAGFELSDAAHGVPFKVFPDLDQRYMLAWPTAESNNAWLVLDRNGDGVVDDLSEMFGNLTPQPEPPPGQQRNGFLALAVFDQPAYGGNNDGWITDSDAIFTELRVWQDANHDGISQPDELKTLNEVGINGISLQYTLQSKTDQFGNVFRYRGTVRDASGSEVRRVIYDVLVRTAPIQ